MTTHAEKLADTIARLEAAVTKARERVAEADREYLAQVAEHERRGDGFLSTYYHRARRETERAHVHLDRTREQLAGARHRAEAPTLEGLDS